MNNEDFIRQLGFWTSGTTVKPIDGGITNHNYLVTQTTESGVEQKEEKFVVRLGRDIPVHQILRFNELAASTAAHAAGLSPAIRYHEPGVLIMDYILSDALDPLQVQQAQVLERVLALIKRCHVEVPVHLRGASVVFWVFHVLRDYAATLSEGNSRHVQILPDLLRIADELEHAAKPFDIVFCHNDLLAANILDDGDRLWLIDWEYGGFNTPLFDLGGLASNNELTEDQEHWMLETYFEKTTDATLWRRYQAMKCASLLRETMWSMISEIHSTLDFDYSAYTAENMIRFRQSHDQFAQL